MAQARWTGLSMGGPTYIEDPRVQEQIALGELLLRSRQAAQTQADRLFARKQEAADFDERRRQFDLDLARRADAARLQQADNDRSAALAERELQQRAAEAQARQQAAAEQLSEDRLFRRQSFEAQNTNRTADNAREDARFAEAKRQYDADAARRAAERTTDLDAHQQERKTDARERTLAQLRADALRQAEIAGADEQRIRSDMLRTEERALERKQDASEFDRRLGLQEKKREDGLEKALGSVDEQRTRGLANALARFESAVKAAKGAKDEQARQEQLAAAVQSVLFPSPDLASGQNSTDVLDASGRPLPVWRPSPEDLEALKPALLETMARHFPQVKKTGYPAVARALDVPLIAPLTQLGARGLYELSGLLGDRAQNAVGDWQGIPRWTSDPGAEALEQTLKRNEKAQALFRRK